MKKILPPISVICLILLSFFLLMLWRNKKVVTISYTVDLQGFITPHEDPLTEGRPLIGGSAYLATYIKEERKSAKWRNNGFFLLDTGNFFSGQAEGYFFKGASMIEIMNRLGYDAMAVGPKDFVFGEENLKKLAKKATFSFLSTNIVREDTGEIVDYVKPYIIKEHGAIKIGIVGVTNPSIFPEQVGGLKILDPILTTGKYVSQLNDIGINIVIVLSNLGLEEDKRLAQEVKGINMIIGGNDRTGNRLYFWPFYIDSKNKTIIVETYPKGAILYKIDCILGRQGKILKYKPKWYDLWIAKIKPDLEIQSIVQKYVKLSEKKKNEFIGYAQTGLTRSEDMESTLGDWVADILRQKTKTDIALVGGLQTDLKQGEVTLGDIYNILPIIEKLEVSSFNLAIVELSGEQIKNILERSVGLVLEDSKYEILQLSGLKMVYNPKQKIGRRVVDVTVNGEKLDMSKVYKAAINGFLASGGDGYYDIITAEKRINTSIMDFDVIAEYVKIHSPIIAPPLEGRIVRVEEK